MSHVQILTWQQVYLELIYSQRKEKPSEEFKQNSHNKIEIPADLIKNNKKVKLSVDTITVNGIISYINKP